MSPCTALTRTVFTCTHLSIVANGPWKPRPTLKFNVVTPVEERDRGGVTLSPNLVEYATVGVEELVTSRSRLAYNLAVAH